VRVVGLEPTHLSIPDFESDKNDYLIDLIEYFLKKVKMCKVLCKCVRDV